MAPNTQFNPPVATAESPLSTATTVAIVIGGDALATSAWSRLAPGAFVIAADSGLDRAREAGLRVDLVVGDMDSVSAAGLAWAASEGIPVQRHPPDKDATDTELALAVASSSGATDIVILSGGGDRIDHSLGALTALGHPSLAHCRTVTALWGKACVHVLHGPREQVLDLGTGATFSVLALHGACHGVAVVGARWPLDDATIEPGSSLGLSNESIATQLRVLVRTGVLTVIVPPPDTINAAAGTASPIEGTQ